LNTSAPAVKLDNRILTVNKYAMPPTQKQPGAGSLATRDTPLGFCIDNTTTLLSSGNKGCWKLLFGSEPAHDEVISRPDSNDTRMQQVTFVNGQVWGALDTAVTVGGSNRAGVAWFVVEVDGSDGSIEAGVANQGYLAAAGMDLTYPAIGVTTQGRGVMAFTATGDDTYPSAAFAPINADSGVGAWSFVNGGQGAAPDDGFTSYKSFVGSPPRTRWGDYGAAAVDGNSVWIGSEYIAHSCRYEQWGGSLFAGGNPAAKFGRCNPSATAPGVRTALANWSTRISELIP
jgi:hypothetical protein